jgi:hypothetical protein
MYLDWNAELCKHSAAFKKDVFHPAREDAQERRSSLRNALIQEREFF